MKTQFTIGVFGIIFDDQQRVLLCHRRDYDLWNLPSGGLELNESVEDCLKREVNEETGLDVEIVKLVGVYSKEDKNDLVFSFICKPVSGELTLNNEADKIEYFDPNNLPINTVPKMVERIHVAMNAPDKVIFKIQHGKSSADLLKELNIS